MSKCQIAEIPKSPKMQNITKKIQYHKNCKKLKKMPKPKIPDNAKYRQQCQISP